MSGFGIFALIWGSGILLCLFWWGYDEINKERNDITVGSLAQALVIFLLIWPICLFAVIHEKWTPFWRRVGEVKLIKKRHKD